ncbi:hypothetical protein BD560DRAFT_429418 [Blakeslea trispora]|nr:hypothetical protein BD560DRAFT_429418 [Blakeslea trispora]
MFYMLICSSDVLFGNRNVASGVFRLIGMLGFDKGTFWDHNKQYRKQKEIISMTRAFSKHFSRFAVAALEKIYSLNRDHLEATCKVMSNTKYLRSPANSESNSQQLTVDKEKIICLEAVFHLSRKRFKAMKPPHLGRSIHDGSIVGNWMCVGQEVQGNDYKQSKLVDAMYTIAFEHVNGEIEEP